MSISYNAMQLIVDLLDMNSEYQMQLRNQIDVALICSCAAVLVTKYIHALSRKGGVREQETKKRNLTLWCSSFATLLLINVLYVLLSILYVASSIFCAFLIPSSRFGSYIHHNTLVVVSLSIAMY